MILPISKERVEQLKQLFPEAAGFNILLKEEYEGIENTDLIRDLREAEYSEETITEHVTPYPCFIVTQDPTVVIQTHNHNLEYGYENLIVRNIEAKKWRKFLADKAAKQKES